MSGYKEFTGKTLDEAIKEACAFFNVEREKLEIEILNDAKTGIFGLVGAKKATVRARKVSLDDIGLTFPSKEEKTRERGGKKPGRAKEESAAAPPAPIAEEVREAPAASPAKSGKRPQPNKETSRETPREPNRESARETKKQPPAGSLASRRAADPSFAVDSPLAPEAAEETETSLAIRPQTLPAVAENADSEPAEQRSRSRNRGRGKSREQGGGEAEQDRPQRDKKKNQPGGGAHGGSRNKRNGGGESRHASEAEAGLSFPDDDSGFEDQLPVIPLEELDQDLLRQTVLDTLRHLVTPLAGEAASSLSIDDGRVRVRLETVENQGLIIGRDGQTLSALQYLLSCITSRKLGASVRVQIDAGDYREKQEEKLRALALNLAQKVKNTQRPQSTRPLSAYHRRIIHLTLQDDPDVQTHSKSEGNLKSVVIVPRRKNAAK